MTAIFLQADIGRDIIGGGGIGTITGFTTSQTVTVNVLQPFPASTFESGTWSIIGTPHATMTPSAKDPAGTVITLTLDVAGWRAEDVGKYVRVNGGLCKISTYTSPTVVSATIIVALTAIVAAPPLAWTLEGSMWGGAYGWPRCAAIFEQRLWTGGSPGFPQGIWGSSTGEYLDYTIGALDSDALSYIIASGEANPILHMATSRGLLALTTGGEFSVRGGNDRAITPTNILVRDQSSLGCNPVSPVRVGREIYFIQRAGSKVRAISPNMYDDNQYVAPDMATLAEHITTSGVQSMAYAAEPDALLYCACNDGHIATLSCDRDQDVFAWARQITQGTFEDVEAVPTSNGASVFVITARTINGVTTRYVEKFESGLHTDSAITGISSSGATVWGGANHLAGMTVRAKGDGVYLGEFVVNSSGQITLPRSAKQVEIGLDYQTTIITLTPEFMGQEGSSHGAQLSISEVHVRLLNTTGCQINMQEVPFRNLGIAVLDKPPPVFTGIKKAGNLGWAFGAAQTLIQQNLPYDFQLLSVITTITANSG
jgi:hypothetical protein